MGFIKSYGLSNILKQQKSSFRATVIFFYNYDLSRLQVVVVVFFLKTFANR